jgi:hypothetical protein
VTVRKRLLNGKGLLRRYERFVLQEATKRLYLWFRPMAEIRDRSLVHLPAFTPSFSQEDSGWRITVRNTFDIHGNINITFI